VVFRIRVIRVGGDKGARGFGGKIAANRGFSVVIVNRGGVVLFRGGFIEKYLFNAVIEKKVSK
jgi:hypothetical protein